MSKTYKLTPPFDGAVHLPVREGWYNVWLKSMDLTNSEILCRRRYWDGRAFGGVVFIGDTNAEQARCKALKGTVYAGEVYWRGLAAPRSK